jgi:hypothetical protein
VIKETNSLEQADEKEMIDDMIRNQWVMNRMKWLSLLQALFEQLKHFDYNF